ncbi:MAG: hypothetical protein JSW59_01295 [Phycisphaerales bacterium]|nr:MAG: hypothetical protein JSW59_01295 [Phycisphaerales bacterium]
MKRALTLTNAAIVRNLWFVCVMIVTVSLSGPAAMALDPMGPPRASVDEGQFIFGADLSLSETDLKLTSGKWTNPNTTPTSGTLLDRTVDFETSKLYATAGYGFTQNWEAFLGIGATKSEFGDDLWNSGEDFDSGIEFAVRGGVRATLLEFPDYDVQLGGLIQFNWTNYDGKLNAPTQVGPDFVELDLLEMQVAVGATYWWTERVKVYAGPFVHYIKGDLDQFDVSGFKNRWDIDEGPIWGIYLGALVDLSKIAENCVVNIEYQHSSDATALAAGLMLMY